MIVFMATVQARPETADPLAAALQEVASKTRNEPGCLSYQVHRGIDDTTLLVTVEEWRSEGDLANHFEMPYVKELLAQAPAFLAADPIFRKFVRL